MKHALLTLLLATAFSCIRIVEAETILVEPKGEFATIKTQADIALMRKLLYSAGAQQKGAIDETLRAPEKHCPPVLYGLSKALVDQKRTDDAVFWYLAAELRGRYDALRCADDSARSAIPSMKMIIDPTVGPYLRDNKDKVKAAIPKVLAWDERTPYGYDHRWINLHGLAAMSDSGGNPMSVPKSEWPAIRERLRDSLAAIADPSIAKRPPKAPTKDDAMFAAIQANDIKALQKSLAEGANVNASSGSRTPLWIACRQLNPEMVRILLQKKPNLEARNNDGMTPLHIAIHVAAAEKKGAESRKQMDVIVRMLLNAGANPNNSTAFFGSPLGLAAAHGFIDTAMMLLTAKANPNQEAINSPLRSAAYAGDLAMVKLLVSHGANVNSKDNRGESAYDLAKGPHVEDIRAYLKAHGAKL